MSSPQASWRGERLRSDTTSRPAQAAQGKLAYIMTCSYVAAEHVRTSAAPYGPFHTPPPPHHHLDPLDRDAGTKRHLSGLGTSVAVHRASGRDQLAGRRGRAGAVSLAQDDDARKDAPVGAYREGRCVERACTGLSVSCASGRGWQCRVDRFDMGLETVLDGCGRAQQPWGTLHDVPASLEVLSITDGPG